jgi:hypothetical protein
MWTPHAWPHRRTHARQRRSHALACLCDRLASERENDLAGEGVTFSMCVHTRALDGVSNAAWCPVVTW